MNLLMISGDRSLFEGKKGAFWYMLEEFSKHWDRIDIISPRGKVKGQQIIHENVYLHPSPLGLWYQPWWIVRKGKELIGRHHHEVMTVHEYPPFYNGIGAKWLHKKTKIPYALEIHHIVGHPKPASVTEIVGHWLSKMYLERDARKSASVRTVNEEVKAQLEAWGIPEQKVEVIPSFYLDKEFLKKKRDAKTQANIVFCGRLVANKGLNEVIEAVHSLLDVTLLVLGDGPERKKYEAKVKSLGLDGRVTFKGWVPDKDRLFDELLTGSIFVMNSKSEGGPRIALEAMALGLPVIATRVGVMPDVMKDGINGAFTTGEPEDLARQIKRLLDDTDLRKRLGQEAKKITETFDRGTLVKGYADYLKELS